MNPLLLLIPLASFVGYLIFIVTTYGIQPSISATYYVLPVKHRDIIYLTVWSSWAIPMMFVGDTALIFCAAGALMFVAAAPAFRDDFEEKVHIIGTYSTIVLGFISMIFDFHLWPLALVMGLFTLYATSKYSKIKNTAWWLECAAMGLLLIGLLLK
jgi:hypothetical protein